MVAVGDIFLIAASLIIPLACKSIRDSRLILAAIYLVLISHHVLSLFNIYVFSLPGSTLDAHSFHVAALDWYNSPQMRKFGIGTDFYRWILLVNFFIVGTTSKLSTQSLSILAFSLFLIYVIKLLARLQVRDELFVTSAIVLVGFLPSIWLFSSLTFREPFEMLGLAVASYYFLLYIESYGAKNLALFLGGLLFMGMFHQVMLVYGVGMAVLGLIMLYLERPWSVYKKLSLSFLTLFIVGSAGALVIANFPVHIHDNYIDKLLSKDGLIEAIVEYRANIDKNLPRSAYGFTVSGASAYDFLAGLVRSYVSYLFGPTVFEANRSIDMVPVVTTLLRWLAITLCLIGLVKRPGLPYRFLFIIALTLALMWSIGTTNYGQAFRHNALTDWIWIILSITTVHEWLRKRTLRRDVPVSGPV